VDVVMVVACYWMRAMIVDRIVSDPSHFYTLIILQIILQPPTEFESTIYLVRTTIQISFIHLGGTIGR
jgi:hypothetical protein